MTSVKKALETLYVAGIGSLVLASIGFALNRTHGTYSPEFLALVLVTSTGFIFSSRQTKLNPSLGSEYVLPGILVFFLFRLWSHTSIEYGVSSRVEPIASVLIGCAIVSTITFICLRKLAFLFFVFFLLSLFLTLVPFFSPEPHIDVFTVTRTAIQHFLSGTNPYSVVYQDKWSEPFGYQPGFSYPPAPLLLGTVFYKLFGDFRYLYSTCLILSALFIPVFREKLKLTSKQAWILACLWISFPINPLVVEQAWVDPILIASAFGLAIALTSESYRYAALLLGLHLATKQYGVITLVFSSLWLCFRKGPFAAIRMALFSAGWALLICSPFLISNPVDFFKMIGSDVLAIAPRSDAFTLFALSFNEFGVWLPDWLTPLVLLSSGAFFGFSWRKRAPRLSDWAFSLFATTLFVFLFSRRAFANYYHFSVAFLMIYIISDLGEQNESNC